jgi:hypothetical protein
VTNSTLRPGKTRLRSYARLLVATSVGALVVAVAWTGTASAQTLAERVDFTDTFKGLDGLIDQVNPLPGLVTVSPTAGSKTILMVGTVSGIAVLDFTDGTELKFSFTSPISIATKVSVKASCAYLSLASTSFPVSDPEANIAGTGKTTPLHVTLCTSDASALKVLSVALAANDYGTAAQALGVIIDTNCTTCQP